MEFKLKTMSGLVMKFKLKTMSGLVMKFYINGIKADYLDFVKILPTKVILEKYQIDVGEYKEIAETLRDKLGKGGWK